jgi:hypothetical protein
MPAVAGAGWFPAEPLDGPADIRALGNVDLARDGTGAVAYVKVDGGVPHVFVQRMWDGAWHGPERVDAGIGEAASQPAVAVGDNGRTVVAWVSEGRLIATLADGAPGAPFSPVQFLAQGGVRNPDVDLGINGAAYIAYAADGPGGSDVRAVRLQDATWQPIGPSLDIDAGMAAGNDTGRPRIGVSAEGYAVVVWGEDHPDGRRRLVMRRLIGTTLSQYPQEVSVPDFGGQPGGTADMADVAIEDDGSYAWVVFRELLGGAPRILARRLVGSTFDPPVFVDGGAGSTPGRVAINGKGVGVAAVGGPDNAPLGSLLFLDVFGVATRLDLAPNAVPPQPVVGASENEESAVAWLRATDTEAPAVYGRHHMDDTTTFEDQALLSQPGFGPVVGDGGLEMASNRVGDSAVAFLQGAPGERRLVVSHYDRPPNRPFGVTTAKPRRQRRPQLRFKPGIELWGPQTFKLMLDGVQYNATAGEAIVPPAPLSEGKHEWQVIATDRRGQTTPMPARRVWVDTKPPKITVRVTGRRVRGGTLTIRLRALDPAGIETRWVVFGDGARVTGQSVLKHRYFRPGRFRLVVSAQDKAGNAGRKVVRLRIR